MKDSKYIITSLYRAKYTAAEIDEIARKHFPVNWQEFCDKRGPRAKQFRQIMRKKAIIMENFVRQMTGGDWCVWGKDIRKIGEKLEQIRKQEEDLFLSAVGKLQTDSRDRVDIALILEAVMRLP